MLLVYISLFLSFGYVHSTVYNCGNVIADKEFTLGLPNNFTDGSCRFRFTGPTCPTRYELHFQEFELGGESVNCTEGGRLVVNGNVMCGKVEDVKSFYTNNGSLSLELHTTAGKVPKFRVHVKRLDCNETFKGRRKEVEETTVRSIPEVPLDVQQLQLVNERTEILDDEDDYPATKPKVYKSVYFFAAPEYFPGVNPINPTIQKEVEQPNFDQRECTYPNQINTKSCRNREIGVNDNCIELNYLRGYFRSPGYPFYYPSNLNLCYRFIGQPGYCAARIFMNDFQLEKSYGCNKDYFYVPGDDRKYCGLDLFGRTFTIDLSTTSYADVRFVSDPYWCGRGFSAVYELIRCQPYPPPVEVVTTTERAMTCDRVIGERMFQVQADGRQERCVFRIVKSSTDVCKIRLYFHYFNINCPAESFTIDGRNYCGNQTGRTVSINLSGPDNVKEMTYRNTLYNPRKKAWTVKIDGEQISDDCMNVVPEVPAQRLMVTPRIDQDTVFKKKTVTTTWRQHFEDLCRAVKEQSEESLPEAVCDILKKNQNVTDCFMVDGHLSGDQRHLKNLCNILLKQLNSTKCIVLQENGTERPSSAEYHPSETTQPSNQYTPDGYMEIDCDNTSAIFADKTESTTKGSQIPQTRDGGEISTVRGMNWTAAST